MGALKSLPGQDAAAGHVRQSFLRASLRAWPCHLPTLVPAWASVAKAIEIALQWRAGL